MHFGFAIETMKAGKRVYRDGWNGKGMYIFLLTLPNYEPVVCLHNAQGKLQPGWLPSQADIFAEDWNFLSD